eukprot:gene7615-318_t
MYSHVRANREHKKDIKRNPHFRKSFQQMCDLVGVDCLASKKGFWSELLGIGDFYYDLSVQVVECCLKTSAKNGGLIEMNELQRLVTAMRGPNLPEVTCDDIAKSIDKLTELGRGFQTHAFGDRMMVQSVPTEFNQDHSAVLGQAAAGGGKVTAPGLCASVGWAEERAATVLEQLVKDGMAWVDDQAEAGAREYWLPGLIAESDR